MAWSNDSNFGGMMVGARCEWGTATLVGGTVEVPTRLKTILSAVATFKQAPAAATQMYSDGVITAGAVTFADAGVAAKTFTYLLIGK